MWMKIYNLQHPPLGSFIFTCEWKLTSGVTGNLIALRCRARHKYSIKDNTERGGRSLTCRCFFKNCHSSVRANENTLSFSSAHAYRRRLNTLLIMMLNLQDGCKKERVKSQQKLPGRSWKSSCTSNRLLNKHKHEVTERLGWVNKPRQLLFLMILTQH